MRNSLLVFTFALCLGLANAQGPVKYVVYFPFNKETLTSGALSTLQQAVKDNTGKMIDSVKIYAHCDSIGSIEANEALALKRAEAVKQFLIEQKIRSSAFKDVTGYGKRQPVNDNSTEALRQLNRRAVVLIFAHDKSVPKKEIVKAETPVAAIAIETKPAAGTVSDEIPVSERKALDGLRKLMSTAEVGKTIRLPNLNFYGSRHFVVTESLPTLDTLAAILKSFPQIEVEIQGYVCCVPKGKEAFDVTERKYNLSSTRAQAVYNDLVKNGIAPGRLKHKGYGSQPMVEELTDEDKAMNRRVELKILKR
ncbi:MAG TPA: OmpA family protein [Chitinophagales bacterium]|nr:OmpA family protein [Chitinophagales bacterium]